MFRSASFLITAATVSLVGQSPAPNKLVLEIQAPTTCVKMRVAPIFKISIRNTSSAPVRILDIKNDHSLRDVYSKIAVSANNKLVKVPLNISDPGEYKWITLKAGEMVEVEHDGSPLSLAHLKPGTYSATFQFHFNGDKQVVSSQAVSFKVCE